MLLIKLKTIKKQSLAFFDVNTLNLPFKSKEKTKTH
jgi:hypothetical protein